MSYEAKYKCPWCGEVDLDDKDVEERIVIKEDLGNCPKCGRHSYAAGIRAKFKPDTKSWRMGYGRMQ